MDRATGRRIVRVPLPRRAAKAALSYVPGLNTAMGIPPNAVDYFAHPTHYTVTNTEADLAGTGIRVPPLASYLDTMVGFMARHPEIGAAAMV
jgi:hypothetical protein